MTLKRTSLVLVNEIIKMKTYIICRKFPNNEGKIVWIGDIGCQFVPRIGESIIVTDGCEPEPIKDIVYGPGFGYCIIYIPSDYENIYKEVAPFKSLF